MNDDSQNPNRPLTIRDAALGVAFASLAAGVLIAAIALLGTTAPAADAASGSVAYGGGGTSPDGGTDGDGSGAIFPVRARHTYGDGFGAGRGHQGQDIFARCGARLVAAEGGRIQTRDYHYAAGNYVVIDVRGSAKDHVYMHLERRSPYGRGDRVPTGAKIGTVGETGNASGCHLHFELWSAPGYYEGGSPMARVTKVLRRWDRQS